MIEKNPNSRFLKLSVSLQEERIPEK